MGTLFDRLKRIVNRKNRTLGKNRTIERKKKVDKEDFLLKQIDEFREKAKQLQGLLATKEDKVQELQSIVDEREEQAVELQEVINQRKSDADVLLTGVQGQMEEMLTNVEEKLNALSERIATEVSENTAKAADHSDELKQTLDEITARTEGQTGEIRQALNEMTARTEGQTAEIRQTLQEITARTAGQSEEIRQTLQESSVRTAELNEDLKQTFHENTAKTAEQTEEIQQTIQEIIAQLDTMKATLSDKIHTENVKSFRNVQDVITELTKKLENNDSLEKSLNYVKTYVKYLSWFAVVNFVVLIVFLFYALWNFEF